MYHRIALKLFLILFLNLGLAVYAQEQSQSETDKYIAELEALIAGKGEEPSENVFKNIQAMKGIPAGRLLKIMQRGFSKSLGVDCNHCHNPQDWSSDEKEKKIVARKMWTFTDKIKKELPDVTNKKRSTVNCYTCHRGATEPGM
jgi:hypothetical protein